MSNFQNLNPDNFYQIIDNFIERINFVRNFKDWKKDWSNGGCYLHLEASEFIESLRGKGSSPPEEEACDVLFALLALVGNYNLSIPAIFQYLDSKIAYFEREKENIINKRMCEKCNLELRLDRELSSTEHEKIHAGLCCDCFDESLGMLPENRERQKPSK